MKEEQFFEAFSNIDPQFIEETRNPIPKKRSRKILWRVITGLIAILLIILAILPLKKYSNDYYYLEVEDGEYYLVSKGSWAPSIQPYRSTWHFDSIQEMHDDITFCNFSDSELSSLEKYMRTEPIIAIPNLNNLSQPILPANIAWDGKVIWRGDSYYWFNLSQIPTMNLDYAATTKADFEGSMERLCSAYGSEIVSVEHIEDRNATVYHTKAGNFMVYTFTSGDKTFYVREVVGTNRSTLKMYISDGSRYGYVLIYYTTWRPTIEWLSSFGLEPFEIVE